MASTNPGPAITQSSHPQILGSNQAIRLLAVFQGINANSAGDTVLPIIDSTVYSVKNVVFTNASVSLTTATGGVYTAPNGASGSGTAIVTTAALTALTGPTVVSERTVATTATQTAQNLYLNIGTAQGAAATFDVYVYGYDLTQN